MIKGIIAKGKAEFAEKYTDILNVVSLSNNYDYIQYPIHEIKNDFA